MLQCFQEGTFFSHGAQVQVVRVLIWEGRTILWRADFGFLSYVSTRLGFFKNTNHLPQCPLTALSALPGGSSPAAPAVSRALPARPQPGPYRYFMPVRRAVQPSRERPCMRRKLSMFLACAAARTSHSRCSSGLSVWRTGCRVQSE